MPEYLTDGACNGACNPSCVAKLPVVRIIGAKSPMRHVFGSFVPHWCANVSLWGWEMVVVGLCRFSLVGRGDWKVYRDKSDDEILPIALKQAEQLFRAERMEARLKSFEHLTLASMQAQTDEDFSFIVLASEMMPLEYRQRLEEICAAVPQVTLRFFGMIDAASAQKQVYRELNLSLDKTIQFRLDDDDCVCIDFVEQLKAQAEQMLASDDPFAISLDSTLYCALTEGVPETYHWPIKFFSAGAALKHDKKSIFGFGHFALERRFRSSVIANRMSLATHNGNNDTPFTPEIARQRGCIRLNDDEIAERLATNFPFLSETAKSLAGLPGVLETGTIQKLPQPERGPAPSWLNALSVSKYRRGFYISGNSFALQHTHRRSNLLYVGFDDLSRARDKNRMRDPWGYEFAEKRHWSSLGIMAYRPDWFRSDELFGYLHRLRDDGFFEEYRKVVFSGVSMGAYAACAFSSLAPGSTVIAFSPQSTLNPEIAGWDERYPSGSRADWSGPFSDAAAELQGAEKAWVIFDPEVPEDRQHAERLVGPNSVLLHTRYAAHFTAQFLRQIGALSTVVDACVEGTMTPARFYQLYRPARTYRRFLGGVMQKTLARGGTQLSNRLQSTLIKMEKPGLANDIRKALADHG